MSSLKSLEAYSVIYSATHSSHGSDQQPGLSICDDLDCTYPFGPACSVCYLSLSVRNDKIDYKGNEQNLKYWSEDINARRESANARGETFTGGAEERDEVEVLSHPTSSSDSAIFPSPHLPKTHKAQKDPDKSPIQSSSPLPSNISNPTRKDAFTDDISNNLSPSTNTLSDNRPKGHKADNGLAQKAAKIVEVEKLCSYCFQPLGDPRLQHFLRCKFAHEEKEREERAMRKY